MLSRLGGEAVVKAAHRTGELGKDAIKVAATYGRDGLRMLDKYGATTFLKLSSRGTKIAYRGSVFNLATKMLLSVPRWTRFILLFLGFAIWIPWKLLLSHVQMILSKRGRGPDVRTNTVSKA